VARNPPPIQARAARPFSLVRPRPDVGGGLSEAVLLDLRPHPAFIVLRSWGVLLMAGVAGWLAWWLGGRFAAPATGAFAAAGTGAVAIFLLVWNALVWGSRRYQLTTRRLIRTAGVIDRSTVEIPLERVQHLEFYRSFSERLLGLGSLGFSTAGSAWTDMVWLMIDHPQERLAQVRAAIREGSGAAMPDGEGGGGSGPRAGAGRQLEGKGGNEGEGRLPIIGLAGGIGAGKSEVARILEQLGCLVIDSDQQARQALDRAEVREQLVQWWGPGILKPDGAVDRSQIAKIVFAHEDQRRRLERLIHPLVRARRGDLIRDARAAGARAAVVDAPLLFEAGVDEECDAVIFVDAPRALRLRRVREHRGWTEAELSRRERAQLPLEEKKQRSTHLVSNTGDRDALAADVERVLTSIAGGG
jgi:dephospho-CoA kinase